MRTTDIRPRRTLIVLALVLGCAAWSWHYCAAQSNRFDKLTEDDRNAFAKRFEKEIWPLMNRNGKDGCVGCHAPVHISSMRFKDKEPDKAFRMLLKQGFFLTDDVGGILFKISHKDPKERMPPDGRTAWSAEEVATFKNFVEDLDKKQQKKPKAE